MRKIELLAPARDAEVGIEAFRHGADAVYIGAPRFSARAAAGNSIADIERMAAFGHQFGAKTMVAFNTIVRDQEMDDAQRMLWQLHEAGVDALIIQDLGLLKLDLPPMELHASTQTDNRSVEKVRLMRDLGFARVVLARELSIQEIAEIHKEVPDVELECFVHGALCVCYSGQCYLSAALTGRSANRGECAQPCRLPMDLLDENGRTLVRQKHLLSLRDMNRSRYVRQLIEAGVCSLKIEGRLKDMGYVKNVVAYYRQILDREIEAINKAGDGQEIIEPLSQGHCTYTFDPDVNKSFNRGFTSYFADGRREVMWNFDSPKSMGEEIGTVKQVEKDFLTLRSDVRLHNGDGLVVDNTIGFRLNRFDEQSGKMYPLGGAEVCSHIRPGMIVRRNFDVAFEQLLGRKSAERRIPVRGFFEVLPEKLTLMLKDDRGVEAVVIIEGRFEASMKTQVDHHRRQLSKMGDSIYEMSALEVSGEDLFVPSSVLNQLRREAVAALDRKRLELYEIVRTGYQSPDYVTNAGSINAASVLPSDFKANVLNSKARGMYDIMGVNNVGQAFEQQAQSNVAVMQTKHCLKYAFGYCPKCQSVKNIGGVKDELSTLSKASSAQLKIGNRKFILKFGCKNSCISEIISIFAPA